MDLFRTAFCELSETLQRKKAQEVSKNFEIIDLFLLMKIDFEVLRTINDLCSFNWIIVKTFCQLPWTNQWMYQNSNQEI